MLTASDYDQYMNLNIKGLLPGTTNPPVVSRQCPTFQYKHIPATSPRLEPGFPLGQYGSKCASLINFSEWSFGASANSIRYCAWL